MTGDRFETYVPDLKAVAEFKTSDIDAYLSSAVSFMTEEEPLMTEEEPDP